MISTREPTNLLSINSMYIRDWVEPHGGEIVADEVRKLKHYIHEKPWSK